MKLLLTCLLLLCISLGFAQQIKSDTAFLSAAVNYQVGIYNQHINGQSRLFNGTEYRDYLSRNDEHPYYGIDDWSYGSIIYDDEKYENVAMFYDLSRDRVITEHLLSGAKIELVTDKIREFTINDHPFARLYKDSLNVITEGFYERLYNGKTKVYARREKQLNTRAESNELIYSFEEKNRLYILKDNIYYPVRSKGSVLDVFSDRRPDMKAILTKNNIKFKKNRETAIVRMAEQYDIKNN